MTIPQDPGHYDIPYQTPPPSNGATLLVRLAVIFNFVAAGLDAFYALYAIGIGVFMGYLSTTGPPAGGGSPPPFWVLIAVYGAMGLMSILVGAVKTLAAFKLMRRRKNAFGWGLAAGIVGCIQLWCSLFCFIPLGIGIYTIVILSMGHVRAYLKSQQLQTGGFEIQR